MGGAQGGLVPCLPELPVPKCHRVSPQFPCRAQRRRRKERRSTCTCTSSSSLFGNAGQGGFCWGLPLAYTLSEAGGGQHRIPLVGGGARSPHLPQLDPLSHLPACGMQVWGAQRGRITSDPHPCPIGTTSASGTPPSSMPCTASAGSAPPPPGRILLPFNLGSRKVSLLISHRHRHSWAARPLELRLL